MASTLGSLLILVNTVALMAQRYYAFKKAYNVVCIQPLQPKRVTRGHLLALTAVRLRGGGRGAHPLAHHHHLLVHAHARAR